MANILEDRIIGGCMVAGLLFAFSKIPSQVSSYSASCLLNPPQVFVTRDVNGNNIPEKYIELGGKKYFLEIDGKPVEEYLQTTRK